MKTKKRNIGNEIIAGLKEAVRFARGGNVGVRVHVVRVPNRIDVRSIRRKRNLSQAAFAHRYGFALSALRDWEQGRRQPERSARILLRVIEREPKAVERALAR